MKKHFVKFLSLIGIDFEKYKNEKIVSKNGDKYTFAQIDKKTIFEYDWIYPLAKNGDLVVFDYMESSISILNKIKKSKLGLGTYGHEKIKIDTGSLEWLQQSANLSYFINSIGPDHNDNRTPIFLDCGSENEFVLASIVKPKYFFDDQNNYGKICDANFEKVKKAAQKLRIAAFGHNTFTSINKQIVYAERNKEEIKKVKEGLSQQARKLAEMKFDKVKDAKLIALAEDTFVAIAEFGLDDVCVERTHVKQKVIHILQVLLSKKWANKKELVELEANDGTFYHWLECEKFEKEASDIDMIIHIKERLEEMREEGVFDEMS